MPGGPEFVLQLRRAWDNGDAVFPLDLRLPHAAREAVLASVAPTHVVDHSGEMTRLDGRGVENGDALVVATSGSTGTSKGVVLTHAAVQASAHATSERLGVTSSDRWFACLPLAHVGGLSVVTRSVVLGLPLTVVPAFTEDSYNDAASEGCTLTSLVATALRRIDASRFRTIVLGGSQPPRHLPPNVVTTYGMTESGSGVVYDGVPLDGVEVTIRDGEIHLRAPMMLRAYRDESTPFTADGWYPTGDLGSFDDGRLVVHGRASDLIITGGENVWPEPVEEVIRQRGDVADVCVIGLPDDTWGQRVTAFIVPTDEMPSLEEVRDTVKHHLPAFCAPHEVRRVNEVPRTALGKPRRRALREI